jgi:hypothetical protein
MIIPVRIGFDIDVPNDSHEGQLLYRTQLERGQRAIKQLDAIGEATFDVSNLTELVDIIEALLALTRRARVSAHNRPDGQGEDRDEDRQEEEP